MCECGELMARVKANVHLMGRDEKGGGGREGEEEEEGSEERRRKGGREERRREREEEGMVVGERGKLTGNEIKVHPLEMMIRKRKERSREGER